MKRLLFIVIFLSSCSRPSRVVVNRILGEDANGTVIRTKDNKVYECKYHNVKEGDTVFIKK